MTAQIKITQLTNIGSANLATTTLLPVVNMAGTPTTQKTTLGNLANVILSQAGGNYSAAATANIAYSVTNAAQPNITSVGTLTSLTVSGVTDLGDVADVIIGGGTDGYVLQTDGAGNLSWTAQTGGGGNGTPGGANTQIQFNDAGSFAGNTGFTFNKTTGILTSPFLEGNGNGLSNIQVANVSGLGNVALINKDGNASNVLYGNGLFAPGPNTGDINFNGANISTNTINANISINGYGTDAHVAITSNNLAWTFEPYGTLDFPDGSRIGRTDGPNTIGIDTNAGDKFVIQTEDSSNNIYSWQFTPLGALIVPDQNPGQASIVSYSGGNANIASFVSFVTPDSANLVLGTTSTNHVVINTDKSNANVRWSFDDKGQINIPPNSASFTTGRIQSANGYPTLLGYGSAPDHGGPELDWMNSDNPDDYGNTSILRNTMYINDSGLYVGLNENNVDGTFSGHLTFDSTGNLTVPGIIVGPSTGDLILKGGAGGPTGQFAISNGPTYGYGGELAIFVAGDFTSGSPASVQVGNIVVGNNGVAATVVSIDPGIVGPGSYGITLDALWSGSLPYTYYAGVSNQDVTIDAGSNSWAFGSDGNLTLPGNLIAAIASPAPSISGFSSVDTLFSVTSPTALSTLTAITGARAFINDSNLIASGNFGAQVGNGGSNTVPVWSDGTNWYIG